VLEDGRDVLEFRHPLSHAAVYQAIAPERRAALHIRAAAFAVEEAEALRHRVAAADGPDEELASVLDAFADREGARGAWNSAAARLIDASRLSATREDRERRILTAVDAMVSAGEGDFARAMMAEVSSFTPGARRDFVLGVLSLIGPDPKTGEALLRSAWQQSDPQLQPRPA